jgi:periplasmic protein TonB
MYTGASLAGYKEPELENRRLRLLAWAVLASLVLHAFILIFLSQFREFTRTLNAPEPPLIARLKPKPPEPPPPAPKAEPVVVPAPLPPRPAPVPKAKPQASPSPAPKPAPVQAAPQKILAVEPSKAEPAFTVPAVPAPTVAATEGQPGTAPAASQLTGPDPGSIGRFRVEFMEIAGRYKRYPRVAQDNNWEGRVELRIAFSETGAISSINVRKGTGRPVLDEEAMAMIRRAQPHVTIPPALRGRAFTLDIPVDFFLK